ncbi:extracellular matrix-binding protein ebh [Manduca sexta]|uniref:extracellular matrix-binding protein ebh n=1 Tax=Manduca sexta TaxID=7130 RepID=UPI00188E97EB|nr:extracellular matrix-binding protein ebh [Manduca sexta]
MECTQRLECTQDLYETHSQRCPKEIGFLGICGTKYPVKKGFNKIGRDPQTCTIILNLNTVSRQHAVINVLGDNNYMIMDLGSANKTKLGDRKLQPYVAHPLRDGDTVQFGDVFGIFRLLEQDDDLPMTQAIDIPETPVSNHYVSRINKVPITMVPESPDVSDKEDSFVAPSQKSVLNESNHLFVRPSNKTTSIQSVGSNKINNVFWNSSKKSKSLSLSLNNSNVSLDSSDPTVENRLSCENNDIHEMETQDLLPKKNNSSSLIYAAETQMPEDVPKQSIYSQDTQADPTIIEHKIPGVQRVNTQHEMEINLYTSNKENEDDVHEAETQLYQIEKASVSGTPSKNLTKEAEKTDDKSNEKNNSSHDVIIFDEIDTQSFDGPFESQSILPEDEMSPNRIQNYNTETNKNKIEKGSVEKPNKRNIRVKSNDSTDCEDMDTVLTQVIPTTINNSDEDVTDCEDNGNNLINETDNKTGNKTSGIEDLQTQIIVPEASNDTVKNLHDMATQIIVENTKSISGTAVENREEETNFEDLPTQIIVEDINQGKSAVENNPNDEIDYADLPTQILVENIRPVDSVIRDVEEEINYEDLPTQIINQDVVNSPKSVHLRNEMNHSEDITKSFKIPLQAPKKSKQKDISTIPAEIITLEDDQYYQSTQDIYNDLNSQEECGPEIIGKNNNVSKMLSVDVNNMSRNSIIDCIIGYSSPSKKITKKLLSDKTINDDDYKIVNKSPDSNKEKQLDGGDSLVKEIQKMPSDSSDVDATPKKKVALKFTENDLPNTQEIKEFIKFNPKHGTDILSSDSETENNSQEEAIPLFSKKNKRTIDAKMDLTKTFEALPTRIITRVRKPTEKGSNTILKPTFLTEQEDGIDKDIINENISRLKTIFGRPKSLNKESNKILDKSSLNKEKGTTKQDERGESSKSSKSKVNEKSTLEISKVVTKKDSVKADSNCETKSTNKRTRDRKKDNNDNKKDNEHKSPKKIKVERKPRTKTSNTLQIELQEHDYAQTSLNSTVGSNNSSRRSGRSKKEKTNDKIVFPELETDNVKPKRTYRKRTKKTPETYSNEQNSSEPVTEPRRSRRIKATKDVKENDQTPPKPKSILKPSLCDQSTVYNKSTESVTEYPKSLKRSAEFKGLQVPSPKRSRSADDQNSSLRPQKTHYVLFTTFPTEGVQDKLEKLGAVTVTEVSACSVLLTTALRRTFKLLCAVGLGRPVVGPAWVQACVDTNTIVDPWSYLLKDEEAEKRFHFVLERTLLGKRNYLHGFTVSSTPNVVPPAKEMKQIVECSGGVWGEGGSRWVVVSNSRDSALWPALRRRGADIVSPEFVLAGVLRQIPDVKPYLYL